MLLPVVVLLRRADLAVVVGAALAAKAGGVGFRRIAVALARPAETVRGSRAIPQMGQAPGLLSRTSGSMGHM